MSGTATAPELLQAAREGDNRACEQVLEENNGLIWSVVRRYYGRGVEPDDLYQLGCLGFLKAVRGFDPAFGTQFSTGWLRTPAYSSGWKPASGCAWLLWAW